MLKNIPSCLGYLYSQKTLLLVFPDRKLRLLNMSMGTLIQIYISHAFYICFELDYQSC